MYIVVVNGFPESGKTTFEEMVRDWAVGGAVSHTTYLLSTVTDIKEIAKRCGWNGEKTPEARKFLSDLKDLLTTYNDFPLKQIEKSINLIREKDKDPRKIIFIDCREPDEIQKLVDKFYARTVLVRRNMPQIAKYNNHSDNNVLEYAYDYIIENNGPLSQLHDSAITFYESLTGIINPQL